MKPTIVLSNSASFLDSFRAVLKCCLSLQMFPHPRAGKHPVPPHRTEGGRKNCGYFFVRKSGEELEFDDAGRRRIGLLEPQQKIVNHLHVARLFRIWDNTLVKRHLELAAAVGSAIGPPMIDQHTTHLRSSHGKEVGPVTPLHRTDTKDAHVGLMHDGGGLERMILSLARHVMPRNLAQVGIDGVDQLLFSTTVAATGLVEKPRNLDLIEHPAPLSHRLAFW